MCILCGSPGLEHMKTVQNIYKVCSSVHARTLFRAANWKPANSLVFASIGRAGPSPMILCSSCVKSFLWARERAAVLQRSLIPPSGTAFFPTDAQTLSASTFVCNIHNLIIHKAHLKLHKALLRTKPLKTSYISTHLLTELFEIGHNTVAEAVLHVVSQQVWSSHHS